MKRIFCFSILSMLLFCLVVTSTILGADFSPQSIINSDATTAFSVVSVDIDGDGNLDVVSASDDDSTVEWYGNTDGKGTFSGSQVISSTATGARSVFAADINKDGNVDILSASWGPTNGPNPGMAFAWYENAYQGSPPGNFGPQNVIALHSSPISVVAADLDRDGDLDVISASYGDNTIAWYENGGNGGSWTERVITTLADGAWDVFTADLDNDGDLDVISAANWGNDENDYINENGVAWYENRLDEASNDFGPQQVISAAADGARVVRAADLDQDGDMDVVSASWFDGKIAWYENRGGAFGNPASNQNIIATAEVYTQAMNVADLDNDGDVDVLYGSWKEDDPESGEHKIVWMENANGSGTSWTSHDISTAVDGCQSLFAADLDNDGDLDVLSASQDDNKVAWYENTISGNAAPTAPDQPYADNPPDEATIPEGSSVAIETSPFSDSDGDSHLKTHWQVWRWDTEVPLAGYPLESTQDLVLHQITDILEKGLKYGWRVGYEDADNNVTWSEDYSFKVGNSMPETLETIKAGNSLGDFGMISIVHWPDNPDPQAVFNIKYDPQNYRIGTWDPEQGQYIEFGNGLEMEPGKACWILSRDDLVVNFNGVPVSMTADMDVCLHTHPSTGMGWNMIAPPNAANYRWNDVLVGRSVDGDPDLEVFPVPVTSPVASTLINHRIWEWQNGDYKDHRLDENFVLKYYKGYWVKAIVEGAYLVFPESAQVAGLSTPRNTMLAWKGKAIQWMKRLLPAPSEALADNDTPPMPMGLFDDSVDPVFEGCFIETVDSGR